MFGIIQGNYSVERGNLELYAKYGFSFGAGKGTGRGKLFTDVPLLAVPRS